MIVKMPFALKKEERKSALWLALKEHFEEKISDLRMKNDGDQDELATAKIRGQIATYKQILALDKDLPDVR